MILDKIVAHKKLEVARDKVQAPIETLLEKCDRTKLRSFGEKLREEYQVTLIAEIKKASPSKGLIREDFNVSEITKTYSVNGAAAISVLTDKEFFQGSPEYLVMARETSNLPLLRKDFIIDPYQIYEAKFLGADAILLIMAILSDDEAIEYQGIASALGMECLVEVHTAGEMERALAIDSKIIGVNNRNLQTFKTDLETTFKLREMVTDPTITIVSESGINTRADVLRLQEYNVHAMLVGEALMRESDISKKMRQLLGRGPEESHDEN